MKKRFPVLRFISMLLLILGWFLFVFGGIYFVLAIIGLFSRSGGARSAFALPFVGSMALSGLAMIYAGELVRVFLTIEDNTRVTAEHLCKMVEKIMPKT
jgi:hypothetical protein